MEELKKIAGVTAAKYVEDGMVVGLNSLFLRGGNWPSY